MSADVTVVIPTRDRPELLADALASVAAQEAAPALTVVVDDGSRAPVAGGGSVEVVRLEGRGVSAARNAGLARAQTEWVAFLDDDDLWAPAKLARQLEAVAGGAGFAWCSVVAVDARRRPVGLVRAEAEALRSRLARTNVVGSPSAVLARTELVRAAGGFDEQLSLLADWDLWLRLAATARGVAVPEVLAAYTEHAGSMTTGSRDELARELERMSRTHGVRLGGADLARWSAGARRRSGGRIGAARGYLAAGLRERDLRSLARAPAALLGERVVGRVRARAVAGRGAETAWLEPYRR